VRVALLRLILLLALNEAMLIRMLEIGGARKSFGSEPVFHARVRQHAHSASRNKLSARSSFAPAASSLLEHLSALHDERVPSGTQATVIGSHAYLGRSPNNACGDRVR
jgi:hypothetical protein